MASHMPQPEGARAVPTDLSPARLAVLLRAAIEGGATRADIARDLSGLVAKPVLDLEISALAASGLCFERKGRLAATDEGRAVATEVLGQRTLPKQWGEVREVRLIAKALGIDSPSASRLKAMARPEDLRAEIVARAFGLKHRAAATPSRLRADLAVVALERAFGNRIKGGLGAGAGSGFAPKAGRMLASQLLDKPRDLGTDGRLIAALAADQVGSKTTDAVALRTAILKAWLAGSALNPVLPRAKSELSGALLSLPEQAPAKPAAPPRPRPEAAADVPKPGFEPAPINESSLRPAAANRPDLHGFVREVQRAAAEKSQGWPGNRKAFVVHVFELISARHPDWGITEVEFKAMLAEAHRTGHLALSTSDLRDKSQMQALARSAITYKNTVWHLVRVAE